MRQTIYKYPFSITDRQTIQVHAAPEDHGQFPRVVHVGLDPSGMPCLWIEVDADSFTLPVSVLVFGTGRPLSADRGFHLGSFVDGAFVWHVYSPDIARHA